MKRHTVELNLENKQNMKINEVRQAGNEKLVKIQKDGQLTVSSN